jgi:hypothetical protein
VYTGVALLTALAVDMATGIAALSAMGQVLITKCLIKMQTVINIRDTENEIIRMKQCLCLLFA